MCGGQRHQVAFNEFDTEILECSACHHVFSSFRANPHFDGYWGEEVATEEHEYWKTARARMYQDFFTRFIVGRSGRILDFGSGLGFFVKAMQAHPAWEAHGREISPAAVRYSRETLGLSNVASGRLEEVALPRESFDIITMWDVLDHIPKPDPVLRHAHDLLKGGGLFFIRTPNVVVQLLRARFNKLVHGMKPGVTYMQAQHHSHHYSMWSIRRLLERNGFSRILFVHLQPVRSLSSGKRPLVEFARSVGFEAVRALAVVTGERLNFDNLFVLAYKESSKPR
jgi:2-polyprenyl-3-methyl-5-hydroxy-6-metoxy-1,4-benzoquinol methylase